MRLQADKRTFVRAMEWAKRVCPSGKQLVLSGDVDRLIIQIVTDTSEFHQTEILAEVDMDGTFAVDRDDFSAALASLTGSTASLAAENSGMELTGADGGGARVGAQETALRAVPEFSEHGSLESADLLAAARAAKETVGRKTERGTMELLNAGAELGANKMVVMSTNRYVVYYGTITMSGAGDESPKKVGFVPMKWVGAAEQMKNRVKAISKGSLFGFKSRETIDLFEPVTYGQVFDIMRTVETVRQDYLDTAHNITLQKGRLNTAMTALNKQQVFGDLTFESQAIRVRSYSPDKSNTFSSDTRVPASRGFDGPDTSVVVIPNAMTKALKTCKDAEIQLILPSESRYPVGVYAKGSETLRAITMVMSMAKSEE